MSVNFCKDHYLNIVTKLSRKISPRDKLRTLDAILDAVVTIYFQLSEARFS